MAYSTRQFINNHEHKRRGYDHRKQNEIKTITISHTASLTDTFKGGKPQTTSKKVRNRKKKQRYVKKGPSKQDLISKDINKMYELVKNYVPIPKRNYKDIMVGTWIRYISHEGKFRYGGLLVFNGAPKYFTLICFPARITWYVNLTKNKMFMKQPKLLLPPGKDSEEVRIIKNKLYTLFKKGYIEFKNPKK